MNISEKLLEYLLKIDKILTSEKKVTIKVFTIGNTRISNDMKFYFTPIRIYENILTAGVIVFSEDEASKVMSIVDGIFPYLLIDSEKKSISINEQKGIFNLERLSHEVIKKSVVHRFKGNDLTTNSIEDFISTALSMKGKLMGGNEVLVIGLGNLGFKITLRLVELGMSVYVKNRTQKKVENLLNAINSIKPVETIASATNFNNFDFQHLLPKISIIILCTTSIVADFEKFIPFLRRDIVILDVGKGCISNELVAILRKKNILIYRLDIGDALAQFIFGNVINKKATEIPHFRILPNGKALLNRGIVGLEGDLIVDNIDDPKVLHGICDGKGSFLNMSFDQEKDILKYYSKNF
jgi:hypothetical protein